MIILWIMILVPVFLAACWWDQLLAMVLERRLRRHDHKPARRRADGGR
ncbi:hypothetical protein [Sphingomonas sp.]